MAPKQTLTPDNNLKLLVAIIKQTEVKPDWKIIAAELNIVSPAAAAKRYERFMKSQGVTKNDGNNKSSGDGSGRDDSDSGTSPKEEPKKRKAAGAGGSGEGDGEGIGKGHAKGNKKIKVEKAIKVEEQGKVDDDEDDAQVGA